MRIFCGARGFFSLPALFLLAAAVMAAIPAQATAASGSSAALAVNALAAGLYGKLAAESDTQGNFCFSPYSVTTALAMTYAGAAGETAAEMKKNLHFADDIHGSGAALREALQGAPGAGLLIANSVWPQSGYRFLRSFTGLLKDAYETELVPVDFRGQPERSRATINDWTAEHTGGKITDILPPGSVDADSRLVLVNALYFKAAWADEFSKSATSERDFFTTGGSSVTVPMMHSVRYADYFETDAFQAARLPYAGGAFSMMLVLPKERDGLSVLEGGLDAGLFDALRSKPERRRVDLWIPTFKAESTFDLASALRGLGVSSAFDDGSADFSLMNGRWDLYISAVAHKAFVEAYERGTEAAAATAVGMARMSAPYAPEETPVVFRADHPFVFLIRDDRSGAILFMGRVARP